MPDPTIRPALPEDFPAIQRLSLQIAKLHNGLRPDVFTERAGFTAGLYKRLLKKTSKNVVLVAVDADEIVGCLSAGCKHQKKAGSKQARRWLYVGFLCVDETRQRQGISRRLMEEAELLARLRGMDSMELTVYECNEAALRFYEHCGFVTQKRVLEKPLEQN